MTNAPLPISGKTQSVSYPVPKASTTSKESAKNAQIPVSAVSPISNAFPVWPLSSSPHLPSASPLATRNNTPKTGDATTASQDATLATAPTARNV